jgi:hypothetical protein
MVDQDLLTVFVALTAAAVLLQTGILAGIYIMTRKLGKQADRIAGKAHRMMGNPADHAIETLQNLTVRMAEYEAVTQRELHQLEQTLDEKETAWREYLSRLAKRTA